MANIGSGIYLGASTIDHSCQPNAVATFRNTTIYIRALEDLPDNDWSKVRISYIDLMMESRDRQRELQDQYYFLCDCPRCKDQQEDQLANSMLCQNCSYPVYTNRLYKKKLECSYCGETTTKEVYEKFLEAVKFTQNQHNVMKDMAYLDICKMCLERQEGLFHPLNILHVKTLDMAFESSIQLAQWKSCEEIGQRLIQGYRRYYGPYHPLLGIHYIRLGKVYLYKEHVKEAVVALEKADEIISVTHGKTHELYRQQLYPLILDAKSALHAKAVPL